jgi:hypothetical protein
MRTAVRIHPPRHVQARRSADRRAPPPRCLPLRESEQPSRGTRQRREAASIRGTCFASRRTRTQSVTDSAVSSPTIPNGCRLQPCTPSPPGCAEAWSGGDRRSRRRRAPQQAALARSTSVRSGGFIFALAPHSADGLMRQCEVVRSGLGGGAALPVAQKLDARSGGEMGDVQRRRAVAVPGLAPVFE